MNRLKARFVNGRADAWWVGDGIATNWHSFFIDGGKVVCTDPGRKIPEWVTVAIAGIPLPAMNNSNRVIENLYQGGALAPLSGFEVLVLCAAGVEPEEPIPDGVEVLRCRLHDCRPSGAEALRAAHCARLVAERVALGKRVLVTCLAGLNRSGLVVGLALRRLGFSPRRAVEAVEAVREARGPDALSNPHFVALINRS